MMKKMMTLALAAVMTVALAACGGSSSGSGAAADSAPAAGETAEAEPAKEETAEAPSGETKEYKVGIVKFMDHPSLNQIESNIMAELDALSVDGVVYNYKDYTYNGNGDGSVLNQIAAQLIDDKVDVIIPIATPAAQIVQAATEGMDIPIVFSAVSDPVSAGLVASMEAPGANITGTSDYLNTNAIMDLIFAADPDADYIGLLYSKSEDASAAPIADAKAYLDSKNIKYIEKTGTTTDEVSQAADALIAEGVDAVFTPTDNTIQNAELAFFEKLAEAKIPHYAGADSFALNGAFCGYGVDYSVLGTATGDMVAAILHDGQDVATYGVQTFDNGIATVNTETAAAIGLDLDAIKEAFGPYCTQIVEITTAQDFE